MVTVREMLAELLEENGGIFTPRVNNATREIYLDCWCDAFIARCDIHFIGSSVVCVHFGNKHVFDLTEPGSLEKLCQFLIEIKVCRRFDVQTCI